MTDECVVELERLACEFALFALTTCRFGLVALIDSVSPCCIDVLRLRPTLIRLDLQVAQALLYDPRGIFVVPCGLSG